MRIVSLNLDLDDVDALHQAIGTALASCACGAIGRNDRCPQCTALAAIAGELDGLRSRSRAHAGERSPRQLLMPATADASSQSRRASAKRGERHLVLGLSPIPEL